MKAVFTGNPYKFWIHGDGGELHLFDNDRDADEFATQLATEYDAALADCPGPYTCDNPATGPECAPTWAKLLSDYAGCCGFGNVVLHYGGEGLDLIYGALEVLTDETEADWTWFGDGTGVANIYFVEKDFYDKFDTKNKQDEELCRLLFELYDNSVCEIFDDDGEYIGDVARNWQEMVAA